MDRPLNLTFRRMGPSEAVEARVRDKVAQLERHCERISGCDVVVEAPPEHPRRDNVFTVHIELRVPGAPPIVIGRPHHDRPAHQDVYVAIRDAFDVAHRRLLDHVERKRGDVKHHDTEPHGRVGWKDASERYGFIQASDGTEVYFHENALVDVGFDDLQAGDEVRFVVHEKEGAKGPQASTVYSIGKHHLVG